jgi:ribosomal protein L24E
MKLIDIGFRDWEKLPVCKYCGEKLYKGQIDFCNDRCNESYFLKHLPIDKHYQNNH